jgi:hypothetical protein
MLKQTKLLGLSDACDLSYFTHKEKDLGVWMCML